MADPNYTVVCAHLRAAKLELDRHLAITATATVSEHLRKSLTVLSAYEQHYNETTPERMAEDSKEGGTIVEAAEKTAKRAKK